MHADDFESHQKEGHLGSKPPSVCFVFGGKTLRYMGEYLIKARYPIKALHKGKLPLRNVCLLKSCPDKAQVVCLLHPASPNAVVCSCTPTTWPTMSPGSCGFRHSGTTATSCTPSYERKSHTTSCQISRSASWSACGDISCGKPLKRQCITLYTPGVLEKSFSHHWDSRGHPPQRVTTVAMSMHCPGRGSPKSREIANTPSRPAIVTVTVLIPGKFQTHQAPNPLGTL
jgi:hypothetical protein